MRVVCFTDNVYFRHPKSSQQHGWSAGQVVLDTTYGPSVPDPIAALVRVADPVATVVFIVAAAIAGTFASAPTATATTTPSTTFAPHIDAPFVAPAHAVPGPSELWPDAASVLVTATVAPTLAATFDSAASTRSGAIPASPVHPAALHRGQRRRCSRAVLRAACA